MPIMRWNLFKEAVLISISWFWFNSKASSPQADEFHMSIPSTNDLSRPPVYLATFNSSHPSLVIADSGKSQVCLSLGFEPRISCMRGSEATYPIWLLTQLGTFNQCYSNIGAIIAKNQYCFIRASKGEMLPPISTFCILKLSLARWPAIH